MSHVALLIDYENIHWSLRNFYNMAVPIDDLAQGLRAVAAEHGTLCLALAYADFDNEEFRGLSGQLLRRGIEPQYVLSKLTADGLRKNAVDIEMSVDAVELIFTRPDITTFVFATGDRDMLNVARKIHHHGKMVHSVASEKAMSIDLRRFTNRFTSLEELLNIRRYTAEQDEEVPLEQMIQDVILRLDILEQSRLPFVGLKYFIENHFPEDKEGAYRAVNRAIAEGLIITYQVPNPYGSFPVTACRLNRDRPAVKEILESRTVSLQVWRPVIRRVEEREDEGDEVVNK